MRRWLGFFVGTPERFLVTAAGITLVWGLFNPDKVERALYGLLRAIVNAISPFVEPLLTLVIIVAVIAFIIRAIFRKGGGGK